MLPTDPFHVLLLLPCFHTIYNTEERNAKKKYFANGFLLGALVLFICRVSVFVDIVLFWFRRLLIQCTVRLHIKANEVYRK